MNGSNGGGATFTIWHFSSTAGMSKHSLVIGIVWYTAEEWRRVRDASADPEVWESSYEEWLPVAQKAERDVAADGHRVCRVHVTSRELIDWCAAEHVPLDATARSHFVRIRLELAGESETLDEL